MYNVFLPWMRNKLKYLFIILPILVILNASCVKNETCISSNNNLIIEFYKIETDTTYSAVTVDSLTVYYQGFEDSLVYDRAKGLSSMELPLSDTSEVLNVILEINDGTDFMRIFYTPFFVFRSTECGVINRYQIDSIYCTGNQIDALWRENSEVNESEAVNLFMFVDVD